MTELTNRQRRCLGLEEISDGWNRLELAEGNILYFDGDTIRKVIICEAKRYHESSMEVATRQNRTRIVPKTSRGKLKKLTWSNVLDRSSRGMYIEWDGNSVMLANYTTQTTYYLSSYEGVSVCNQEEWRRWLEKWVAETNEERRQEVQKFAAGKKKHCRYKEGDFFRFRYDRDYYGYGRILFDVQAWKKQGNPFWDILMGKPLVVQVYHIVTQDPAISVQELDALPACPSQFIMDNLFYYGECKIMGNMPLAGKVDYPVLYGRSIDAREPDKVIFCRGKEYREFSLEDVKPFKRSYINNSIGWTLDVRKDVVERCIQKKSNQPYWDQNLFGMDGDLRNPKNCRAYQKVLKQVGVG